MTIDEAIAECKENDLYQVADWLEELKTYRESSYGELHDMVYNKAIDDFIKECDKYCGYYKGENKIITRDDMLMIAENLKATLPELYKN